MSSVGRKQKFVRIGTEGLEIGVAENDRDGAVGMSIETVISF